MNTLLNELQAFYATHTSQSKYDADWAAVPNADAKQAIQWMLCVPWNNSLENVWEDIYVSISPFVEVLDAAFEAGWMDEINNQITASNVDSSVKNLIFVSLIKHFSLCKNDQEKTNILNVILGHTPKIDAVFLENNAELWFADDAILNACITHTSSLQGWPYFSSALDTYFNAYKRDKNSEIGSLLSVAAQHINVIPNPIKEVICWRIEKWNDPHIGGGFSADALSILLEYANTNTLHDIVHDVNQVSTDGVEHLFRVLPPSMKRQECGHALFSSVPEACVLLNQCINDEMPNHTPPRGMKKI